MNRPRNVCLLLSLLLLVTLAAPHRAFAEAVGGAGEELPEQSPDGGEPLPEETEEAPPEEEEAGQEMPDLLPPQRQEPPLSVLPDGAAVVYNYDQLKTALGESNQITEVYLGADIVMQGGIDIHPGKVSVIVDGINPLTPEDQTPHILTDFGTTAQTAVIRVNSAAIRSVLMRNLTIVGRNYFGPVTVSEANGSPEAVISYERVDYNGPQIGYHRRGTVRFTDCTIHIHGENSAAPKQEVAEAKHVIFAGRNTIITETTVYSVFWFPLGGSLELADDATLTLESLHTYYLYGIAYCGGTLYPLHVTVGSRAVLDVRLTDMFAPVSGCLFESLVVREGGEFRLTSQQTPTAAVLTVRGTFLLARGAGFFFQGMANSSYPALRLEKGGLTVEEDAFLHVTAAASYPVLVNLVGTALTCDNPSSVLLKSKAALIRAETSAGTLSLSAQQVNYRDIYTEIPQDSPPGFKWEKPGGENFTLAATVAIGNPDNLTAVTSNYTDPDPPGVPPTIFNFSVKTARILAWGRLDAAITAAKAGTTVIGGLTAPGALVRVFNRLPSGDELFLGETDADGGGVFQAHISNPLEEGATVVARVHWNYLSARAEAQVTAEGRLEIFAPAHLEFTTTPISPVPAMIGRAERNWSLTVTDTRGAEASWRLYVRLTGDLTPEDGNYPPLPGAVVFVKETGEITPIPIQEQEELLVHTMGADEELYTVSWQENRGPMLRLIPLGLSAYTRYSTQIVWTLVDGP